MRGFTLLEVLMAVAVAGLALVAIVSAMGGAHATTDGLNRRLAADLVARNLLDRYRLPVIDEARLPTQFESGTQTMGGYTLPYAITAVPTGTPGLMKMTINVYDEAPNSTRRLRTLSLSVPTR